MELRLNRHGVLIAKAVAFLLLIGICSPAFSADILLVGSSTSKTYAKVIQALKETFKKQCELNGINSCSSIKIETTEYQKLQATGIDKSHYKLIISLGQAAAKTVQKKNLTVPQLYTLISERLYQTKLRKNAPPVHSAVFLDQR